MKKLSVLLISIIMTVAFIPAAAFADDVPEGADVTPISEEPADETEVFTEIQPAAAAQVSGEGIEVTWEYIDGAASYELFRSYKAGQDPSGLKPLKVTEETSYFDKKVTSGKDAYYYVRAFNGEEYSLYSEPAVSKIIRVFVETGHGKDSKGKWDPGCRWKKYQEAKLMIPITKAMTKYLRQSGIYVYTDAFSGNNTNLFWMLNFANKHSLSALVNVHCDYYKAKAGTLPLYRTAKQKKLAKALNKGVHSEVKIKNRGLKKRKDLKTLNSKKVHCPACLFETGCISKDNKILRNKADAYGKGLAKGLCNYLGVEFNDGQSDVE